ncbi:DUF7322 domain-containing protein [Halobaculum sp. EA56]|uniref:DUF7322 domain-containing protein n=1 Tax=Halobaculum sp. EA56 TaxID=3421648 RepID=UPI003EBBB313
MLDDDDDGDLFGLERQASEAEERGPRVDVPSVDNPADSLPDPESVDPAVQRSFWMAVVYANVALFGVSLGLMLVGFRGQWRWGGAAAVVGVLAGVRVYQTYRAFERRREERADGDAGDGDADDGTDDDGDAPADPDPADVDADGSTSAAAADADLTDG